jgi:hypothetical protein
MEKEVKRRKGWEERERREGISISMAISDFFFLSFPFILDWSPTWCRFGFLFLFFIFFYYFFFPSSHFLAL